MCFKYINKRHAVSKFLTNMFMLISSTKNNKAKKRLNELASSHVKQFAKQVHIASLSFKTSKLLRVSAVSIRKDFKKQVMNKILQKQVPTSVGFQNEQLMSNKGLNFSFRLNK